MIKNVLLSKTAVGYESTKLWVRIISTLGTNRLGTKRPWVRNIRIPYDLGGDEFYTKQDFLSKSSSIPPLLSSYLQGIYFLCHICQFVSELINKQKSRKSGISTIAENKLYAAHHKTQLQTMKVYNTRPVSLTIKVLLIKTVLFFNH